MTNRIMLRAHADENTIQFRTVSAHMKSPQRFYVTYDELDRLQRDGCIITNDIHSFARLWLDKRRDRITFEFTWLTGRGFDRVEGVEQTIHLRWSAFRAFLETCRQPDGLSFVGADHDQGSARGLRQGGGNLGPVDRRQAHGGGGAGSGLDSLRQGGNLRDGLDGA